MKFSTLLLLTGFLFSFFCEAQTCRSYKEAIADGSVPFKTTTLKFDSGLQFELDYVRDQENYRQYPYHCFGYADLPVSTIKKALSTHLNTYNTEDIVCVQLYCKGAAICDNEPITDSNIEHIQVCYVDENGNAVTDYINLAQNTTEHYKISSLYASASIYYLFDVANITNNPSIIRFQNIDFDKSRKINYIKQKDDHYFMKANGNRIFWNSLFSFMSNKQ